MISTCLMLPGASTYCALAPVNLERLNALGELLDIRPFDKQAAVCYGDVRSSLEKRGETIGGNDLLIAAHVLSLGWTLVTNNEREFGRVEGLRIENWVEE